MRNKAIIERSFSAWRDGTGGPYDLLAENATWAIVGRSIASKTYDSRKAFMRDVIRTFNARMSVPLRPEIRNLYADGDTVIVFFTAGGTARDGKPYEKTMPNFSRCFTTRSCERLRSSTARVQRFVDARHS